MYFPLSFTLKSENKRVLLLGKFNPTQIYYDTVGYGNHILVIEITGLPVNTSP